MKCEVLCACEKEEKYIRIEVLLEAQFEVRIGDAARQKRAFASDWLAVRYRQLCTVRAAGKPGLTRGLALPERTIECCRAAPRPAKTPETAIETAQSSNTV